ncbi:prostate androgen-regulated mucin-like protein 1 [Centrocercus urophasianus]|uniref:prostate androgen-regulated mucin-like protein 1 n=1 Tax=Centrocercus urophasianus TaxID=9002 RepID=UPI001C64C94A|nr:prostate androgen-regulated mucin-like protein 1 [Centrocercus urophasianus]
MTGWKESGDLTPRDGGCERGSGSRPAWPPAWAPLPHTPGWWAVLAARVCLVLGPSERAVWAPGQQGCIGSRISDRASCTPPEPGRCRKWGEQWLRDAGASRCRCAPGAAAGCERGGERGGRCLPPPPPSISASLPPSSAARAAGTMGCCCRLLLALLLLLPAGLGDDPIASLTPFPVVGTSAGPGSGGTSVPTAAPHQSTPLTAAGPTSNGVSPEVGGRNGSTTAMLSPASTPTNTVTAADSPSVAPSSVPPTLETVLSPWTAHSSMARGTTDSGTNPSPVGTPASFSSSSPHSSTLHSSPGTALLSPPIPTQPPALMKDVPSPGMLAMASSLAMEPTSPSVTVASPTKGMAEEGKSTPSTGVTIEEVPHALSAGSIVAITVTVIVVVVLVFGAAAYLKIRHSSYGRLLDDHDYGSWGNYNNPLYDDS